MSHFSFLQREWPCVLEAARKAEAAVHADPRTACFYARRARAGGRRFATARTSSFHEHVGRDFSRPSKALLEGEAVGTAEAADRVFLDPALVTACGNRARMD